MEKHQEWIEAYESVLTSYKLGTHMNDSSTCAKCLLARKLSLIYNEDMSQLEAEFRVPCTHCPESIFDEFMGCIERPSCSAFSIDVAECYDEDIEEKISLLVEYHEKAIDFLKNNLECTFEEFQEFLKTIG